MLFRHVIFSDSAQPPGPVDYGPCAVSANQAQWLSDGDNGPLNGNPGRPAGAEATRRRAPAQRPGRRAIRVPGAAISMNNLNYDSPQLPNQRWAPTGDGRGRVQPKHPETRSSVTGMLCLGRGRLSDSPGTPARRPGQS